jgi:membrane-bound serine protease (ClpP class)
MRRGINISQSCKLTLLLLAACFISAPPALAAAATTDSASAAPLSTAVIRLEGKVDDYTRDTFFTRFNRAKAAGAKVIIVDLDTYGGMVTSGLDISRFLKNQADVHTIAYVGDKAISAGAMIAIACNEIVMAASAQLGDCAPITLRDDGSLQTMGETERAKSESPILAEFRDSALRNGYDPLLAQSMVSMKIVVRWVQAPDSEKRRFVDEKEFESLTKDGWTEVHETDVPTPVDSDTTLLTVSGKTAAKLGLASAVAPNVNALAQTRNYSVFASYAPGAGDKLIEWLNNPFVRMILMVLFAQCLYASLHAPGHGFAETIAVLSLAILVGVPLLTGYAQWWEIVVLLIGVGLIALELFVIPGFGFTGVVGILMVLFGLIMTFVGKEPAGPGFLPQLEGTWTNVRNGLAMVTTALVCSMLLSMWLRRNFTRLPYLRRLILTTTTGNLDPVDTASRRPHDSLSDYRPVVGAIGEALSELKPGGSAAFFDPITGQQRVFSVLSDVGYVPRGTRIAVRNNGDNKVVVRPVVVVDQA